MQMKVPQLMHGYPSEARSSFWHERQIMASRSRSIWRIYTAEREAEAEAGSGSRLEERNLPHGPHLTTRFAAWSHVESLSGPALLQSAGTGASRRFSPSLSKQSHPSLYSLATVTLRRNGLRRRSGVILRSDVPSNSPPLLAAAARRFALLRSAAAGVTSQTSHLRPLESRNVR